MQHGHHYLPLYSEVCSTLTPTPRPTAYFMTLFSIPTTAWAASGLAMIAKCCWSKRTKQCNEWRGGQLGGMGAALWIHTKIVQPSFSTLAQLIAHLT